jgi:hypothetical protein
LSSNIAEIRNQVKALREEMHQLRTEAKTLNSIMSTTLMLMSQSGLETADDIRQMISLLYALQAAYRSIQLTRMAAGDPLAWAGFAAEVTGFTVTLINMAEVRRPRY